MVYEGFSEAVHVIDRFDIPKEWTKIRSIDFGYTNPFVCLWLAVDPDGRIYLYRELYMSRRTVAKHYPQIAACGAGEFYLANVADHDAEDRATLDDLGMWTVAADKAITPGIQGIEERLKIAGDGKPRLFIMRGSLIERDEVLYDARAPICTVDEFAAYQWPKGQDGKAMKEVPVDKDNHAMDALRYGVRWVDNFLRLGSGQVHTGSGRPPDRPSFRNLPQTAFGGRRSFRK